MRQFVRVALLLMLLVAAAAQRRGFSPIPRPTPPAGTLPSRSGVTPPIANPPVATPPITVPTPPAGAVGGWRKSGGWPSAEQPVVAAVPYAAPYPVYVDSQPAPEDPETPQELPSPAAIAPQPQATIVFAPPPQPAAAGPNAGLVPCGRAPDPQPASPPVARAVPKDDPPSFYIAMKDGWVYIARAYWVDNDTLHYITLQGGHDQVSLALVNREVSTRLNAKRAGEFQLPESE
jgi:hypothetical protein